MGLMRALTLKRASGIPTRSFSTLKGRPQISLPTELISTTNNLSYTAPSIASMREKAAAEQLAAAPSVFEADTASTSFSEATSEHDHTQEYPHTPTTPTTASDASRRSSHQSTGSEPSLTDASSVSSLSSPNSPSTHHALTPTSSYFVTDMLTKPSSRASTAISLMDEDTVDPLTVPTPVLPRRAPSHSKREHERLARRRSQRASLRPAAQEASATVAADETLSPAPLSTAVMPELPEVDEETVVPAFEHQDKVEVAVHQAQESTQLAISQELEQLLDGVAEKMGTTSFDDDEDARHMRERGLKKFSLEGYLDLVGDVWGSALLVFDDVAIVA